MAEAGGVPGAEPRTVVFHIQPGTPRLHIWCDQCLTSAAYECDLTHLTSHGVTKLVTVRGCLNCTCTPTP